jgi:hypothetical protein
MAVAPVDSGSATDLTDGSPYTADTKVNIKAVAAEGYSFVYWTAPAGTFADANEAQTTFTMPAEDVTVTANFAIEIRDWYDLDDVRDNLDGYYILMNSLNSTAAGYDELASPTANGGKGWQPIGTLVDPFAATFDGQGYEIRDLFIDHPDGICVGLFAHVGEGGVIKNLGVVNAAIIGYRRVGSIVAFNNEEGTVTNSYAKGSVTGFESVGVLVGHNLGNVTNSYSSGSVTGVDGVGGLVGWNAGGNVGGNEVGTVRNSYYNHNEVFVNGENIIAIGALFGEDFEQWLANNKFLDVNERLSQENGYYVVNNVSDFKQLLAFGQDSSLKFRLKNDLDLAIAPNFYIPYLAGEFDGNGHRISNLILNFDFVSQCGLFGYLVSGGKVTQVGVEDVSITSACAVGGLVGINYEGTVSNSYVTGNVTGYSAVGGLIGWNAGQVSNSYAHVSVPGYEFVGGLVGGNFGIVSSSYSTGNVTGDSAVGGLTGMNTGIFDNSFWDIETSGQSTSAGGTGKTTAQMQDLTTFSGATWDIVVVANSSIRNTSYFWNIVDDVTYPFLSWQPVS